MTNSKNLQSLLSSATFSLFRFIFGSALIPHLCTTWHIAVIENCSVQFRKPEKYIETYCPADYANHLSFEGWEMLSSSIISTTWNSQLADFQIRVVATTCHNSVIVQQVKERAGADCAPCRFHQSRRSQEQNMQTVRSRCAAGSRALFEALESKTAAMLTSATKSRLISPPANMAWMFQQSIGKTMWNNEPISRGIGFGRIPSLLKAW